MTPHTQKLKFKDQSVQKTKWKETDGQTDRQTDAIPIALPSQLTRSVKIRKGVKMKQQNSTYSGCWSRTKLNLCTTTESR